MRHGDLWPDADESTRPAVSAVLAERRSDQRFCNGVCPRPCPGWSRCIQRERANRPRRDCGDTAKTLLGVEGAGQRSAAVCGSRARITLLLSEFSRAIDTSLVNRVICVPEQAIQTIYTTRLTDR